MEWTPEKMGELAGGGLVVVLLLLGIIKCGLLMRRPTTSKLCVLALLVYLAAWAVSLVCNLLIGMFPLAKGALGAIAGLAAILLMGAAFVLGIIGLATYDRSRFQQGRAQAIWAVVLGSLMMLAVLGAMVFGVVKALRETNTVKAKSAPGRPIENTEFNFSLKPPGRWTEIKPEVVNKLACVALRRTNPEVYCIVIAERLGDTLTLDQLREVAKSGLESATSIEQQSEERVSLNGVDFVRLNTRARLEESNMTFEYEHWLATQRGFSWQVVFWTVNDRSVLAKEARPLMETFHVIDPTLDSASKGTVVDVDRPALGYRTELQGMGWSQWKADAGNALIDFRAKRVNEALLVVPLRFDSEPPDLEALTRGMLSTMDFESIPEAEFKSKPWSPGHDGTGRELEVEREVNGTRFHYILRVARNRESAHLIAGWATVPGGDADLVRRSLDAIKLHVPQGEATKLKTQEEKALGLLLNEVGICLMNRNENETAADWFHQGFKHGNDPTVLGNAGDALERAGLAAKGREMLAPHIDRFPGNQYLGLHFARLQALSGDADGGSATFLRLLDQGLKDEKELLSWLRLLNEREQYPSALRSAEAWVARFPTVKGRLWLAQTHGASGDPTKAVALLEKLHQENPGDTKVALELGAYYNEVEEHSKAAAIAEKLLAGNKESPQALMVLGWSQMGRKWYRDAKISFERAAAAQPDDADIQDAIRRASAALGQGDNSDVKKPIAPVELPKEVESAFAKETVPADFGKGHSCAWLMKATGYHFEKGKPTRRTIYRRAKILTAEGAKDFSSVEAQFEPLGERIFMNRLEVKDAAGKTIAQASLDDAYVRDTDDETATNDKMLHMQVAGVQPGATVEYEITIEDRASSETFDFHRHLFASGLPVAAEAVFITGDVADLHSELAQGDGLKKIRTSRLAAWIARDQPASAYEAMAVRAEQRCPMLWLGVKDGAWEKIGKDYLKQIEDRFTSDKSTEELAATLVSGKTGERDRIAAIARYVQKEIGYKAIEFGVRARRPNSAADTLRLRYGDCKDTSLLMHLLLRAAGIKSHLALVNTDWNTQPALPTLDQFNHMVVQIPSLGQNWLLDATDKSLALALFPADNLWHSHALILDPESPRLIRPSAASPESSRVNSRRTVSIEGNDWHVEETLDLGGYYAGWMRGAFAGLSPAEQTRKAQGILAEQGAAQVHDFRFENIADVDEPARISLKYVVRDGVTTGNGHHSGALPALWERDYLGTNFVKNRKTDFECIYPLHLTSEVVVKLPAPPSNDALESLAQQGHSAFCTWSLKPELRGGDVMFHLNFMAKAGNHPSVNYAAFHEAWESARRAWDKPLNWIMN